MNENYTAEDFARAMFAVHPDPAAVDARYAARMNRDPEFPWLLDGVPGNGDEHMAQDGWVPVVESRITLGALEAAWEAAEQAGECRKGDVLILRDPAEGYSVWRAGDADYLAGSTRILSRAPKREPWADLADVLRGTVWERLSGDVDGLAAAVHAAGWRKGGDDDA